MSNKDICNFNISLNEFKEILNQKEEEDKSPINYIINNSEYELRVSDKIVDVIFKLDIIILNDDLIEIKLLGATNIVKSSKVNKGNIGFDGNYYTFWGKKAGEYNIEINYTLPIKNISEFKNIAINTIGNSKIKVFLKAKNQCKVSPRFSLTEYSLDDKNEKIVEFYAKSGLINITWGNLDTGTSNKPEVKPIVEDLKPIIHSTIDTAVDITDTSIIYNTKITYNIYQASINKLDIEVKGAQIITIDGASIKSYDIYEKSDKYFASIYFEKEIEGEYSLNIYSEQEFLLELDELVIANFSVLNSEREEGSIAIISKTITDIEVLEQEDIRVVDINELPNNLKNLNKIKEGFKFLKTPYFAKLKLIKHKEIPMLVSIINNAIFNSVILKKGIILTSAFLEIKNNNKPFLEIKLPENTIPLSSFIKGKPTKPIKGDSGNMMLSLPKFTSSEETFWIDMVFFTKLDKMEKTGDLKILLPQVDVPVSHLYWKLFLPSKFKYKNFKGNIDKLNYFKSEPPYPPTYSNYNSHDYYTKQEYEENRDYEGGFDGDFDDGFGIMAACEMDEVLSPMVEEAKVQMKDSAPRMKAKKMAKPAPSPSKMASPASAGSISRNITSKRKESLFTQKQFGKIPVKIQIPLVGTANYFEKLFIENEQIELNFNYKRSKKDEVEGI